MNEVFLPRTTFPMRQKISDADILEKWHTLYSDLRKNSSQLPKFILQDGPPFANGKPHMGTAFNRVLKDIIIRYKQMSGFDAPFVPGWDCHGLPIEWKIEAQIREEKKKIGEKFDSKSIKDINSIIAFRKRCREFAEYWINVQREVFKKLGTVADWDNPYITMAPQSEKEIISIIFKLFSSGCIYRRYKPVMWSPVEQTALSEAEIEYKDKVSTSIYVSFDVKETDIDELIDAKIVIWTTTPWTIPGNRAIAYSESTNYSLILTGSHKFLIASDLLESFLDNCNLHECLKIIDLQGNILKNTKCRHPLYNKGYDFDVPLLPGAHVTTEIGTGFVHTAPGHGIEDFIVCQKFGIDVPLTVAENGTYYDSVPLFAGNHVYKSDEKVIEELKSVGALLKQSNITHSYPHSWRSKAPVIFRATEQWFIDLDKTGIRKTSLHEIDNVKWLPERGKNRITSFVSNRQEWCISRQRAWGVPLMFFLHKATKEVLVDEDIFKKIAELVSIEGSDAWYSHPNEDFLCGKYNSLDYEKVMDIVDVWLESGSVYAYVTLLRKELRFPADLYLEGSDQHRGWFQSSLLTCVGTHAVAPYKSVLTHGFIVDEAGYKMSKSLGNVIDPEDVVAKYGVDVLRLLVASSDYTEDMKIGVNILDQYLDLSRKFRNVMKYLLGALNKFTPEEIIEYEKMDVLEKWCLSRINQVSQKINLAIEEFNLRKILSELKNFCFSELSAFYFDIRKDCLYCDSKGSFKRRGYRTVLDILYHNMLRWLAPIMSIATEEAWLHRNTGSIHKEMLFAVNSELIDESLVKSFERVFEIRSVINIALERARIDKIIGSNLQAQLILYSERDLIFDENYWAEFSITSNVVISQTPLGADAFCDNGVQVLVKSADGDKCDRCWKYFENIGQSKLCTRCSA